MKAVDLRDDVAVGAGADADAGFGADAEVGFVPETERMLAGVDSGAEADVGGAVGAADAASSVVQPREAEVERW